MANDLYAHTMDIRQWISPKEAQELCHQYKVPYQNEIMITGIKIPGINQIYLKHNKAFLDGKFVDRFDMEIQINIGRLLRKSMVSMVVLNNKSVSDIIRRLNSILKNDFRLNMKHCDAGKCHISRLDCGIDLKLGTDNPIVLREYIKLLHDSFDVTNPRKVVYSNYKTQKSFDDIKYESITLSAPGEVTGEQRYKYNIYYKLLQLTSVGTPTTEEIKEIANVIRIEKQIYDFGKVTRKSNKLSSLLDEEITENLMDGVRNDMVVLFGMGDYLSESDALSIIYNSDYSDAVQEKLSYAFTMISKAGYKAYYNMELGLLEKLNAPTDEVEKKKKELKDIRKKLEKIGISVASTSVIGATKNINTLIEEQCLKTKKPRKKSKFATIREITEASGKTRFKCNPSIHLFDGSTTRPSIASSTGGTKEECEEKVLLKIKQVANENLKKVGNDDRAKMDCYEYAIQDLTAYKTVVESQRIKRMIDSGIANVQKQIQKLYLDDVSPWVSEDSIFEALEDAE